MGSVSFLERQKPNEPFEEFLMKRQEYRDKSRKTIWPPSPSSDDGHHDHEVSRRSPQNTRKKLFMGFDSSPGSSKSSRCSRSISNKSGHSLKTVSTDSRHRRSSRRSKKTSRSSRKTSSRCRRDEVGSSDSDNYRHCDRKRSRHSGSRHRYERGRSKSNKANSIHSKERDRDLKSEVGSVDAVVEQRRKSSISSNFSNSAGESLAPERDCLSPQTNPSTLTHSAVPVGPAPLKIVGEKATERTYGGALLAGEGFAMAAYIQSGKRIPRRGEIGLTSEEIKAYEDVGFVMSGSRHRRMNAVRIRKENQVISAEEKRALLILNREANIRKENEIIANLKDMVQEKLRGKIYQD